MRSHEHGPKYFVNLEGAEKPWDEPTITVPEIRELAGDFPCPSAGALAGAAGVLAELPDGALAVVDGLALGAMPGLIER